MITYLATTDQLSLGQVALYVFLVPGIVVIGLLVAAYFDKDK